MTIDTSASIAIGNGNGATTVWNYSFLIPNADSVVVSTINTTVTPNVTATIDPSQFTISGLDDPAGGTVTYPLSGSPLATGHNIIITRTVPFVQETDIVNQSGFYPSVLEAALDYLTMLTQQINSQQAYNVSVPVGSGLTAADYLSTIQTSYNGAVSSAASATASATSAAASVTTAAQLAAGISSPSTTSTLIGTGSLTFVVQSGKQFSAGMFVLIVSAANITNYMHGQVVSYSGTSLVVNVLDVGGSGTYADWTISVSGPRGPQAKTCIPIDLTTPDGAFTTGTNVNSRTWRGAFTISGVYARVRVAPTGSAIKINVKKNGSTIFSTIMTIDTGTVDTTAAGTPPVLSVTSLAISDIVSCDITQADSNNVAAGLEVDVCGYYT